MTKWKGLAASMPPRVGALLVPAMVSSVSPLALAVGAAMMSAATAQAQDSCSATTAGGTYSLICSDGGGALATPVSVNQDIAGNRVEVELQSGFEMTVSGDDAIYITGVNGVSLIQQANDLISTDHTGAAIQVRQASGGPPDSEIFIHTRGELNATGVGGTALFAQNGEGRTEVIAEGNLTGEEIGLQASNSFSFSESSSVSITTSGEVRGTSGTGIWGSASNFADPTPGYVTITANNYVSGGMVGIRALSFSDFFTRDGPPITITSTDTVRGMEGDGISAQGGEIDIDVLDVNGGARGIYARNVGTGLTTITTTGTVTGASDDGIYAYNGAATSSLTIETGAGAVTGDDDGIHVAHQGSDPLSITMDGPVSGGAGYGVNNAASSRGGSFEITSTGSLSSDSGVALTDLSDGSSGDASSTLTVEGALNGDALMGPGADETRITGVGATLGNTGAALGSAVLLDGDAGAGSFTAGELDALTFEGWTGEVDGAQMINWEQVTVTGAGDVTFTDTLSAGTGLANENTDDGLLFQVDDGAFARFAQDFTIAGGVNNFGTLDLSGPNGTPGTVLTVDADYTAGSDLILDADAATTTADVLAVGGDVAGVTSITVLDRSTGPAIPGSPILVVDVLDPGATSPPDAFALAAGPVTLGGLLYNLEQRGEDWFLVPAAGTTPGEPARPIPTLPPAGILTLALLLYLGGRRHFGSGGAAPG